MAFRRAQSSRGRSRRRFTSNTRRRSAPRRATTGRRAAPRRAATAQVIKIVIENPNPGPSGIPTRLPDQVGLTVPTRPRGARF